MEHFDLKSEHDPSENSPYDGRNLEKLLEKYHEKLVKTLPFKDACFLASLQTAGLFFGDLKEKVQAKETSAEMTAYFLDHGINNDSESFEKLLTVMEKFNHNPVKHLAKDIRKQCCIERGSLLSSNTCKSDHDSTIHHGDQTHGFGGMIEEEVKKLKGDYHKYKQLLKTTRHGIKINKIEIQLESEASIMKIHEKYNAAYKLLREKEAAAVNEVKTIEEVFMQQLAKQTKLRRLIEKELVACGEKIVTIEKTRQSLSNAGLSARSADELMKQPTAVDAEYEACDVNQIIGCRKRLRIVKGKDEWII